MDIQPSEINPEIVKIGKSNPLVREIFEAYLNNTSILGSAPLTWSQALEMMVLKLDEQYQGALSGWKHETQVARERKGQLAIMSGGEKPCNECKTMTWIVEDGKKVCAKCDAKRGRRALELQNQLLRRAIGEFAVSHSGVAAGIKTLEKALKLKIPQD